MSWCGVVAIMIGAGILGGTINYALTRTERSTAKDLFWAEVVGIGASGLVPLFLNTISSDLLVKLLAHNPEPSVPFVFGGFCLLAAIASKAMIQTLTQKVLQEVKTTRAEVSALQNEVGPIINKETEGDENERELESLSAVVGDEQALLLKALKHPRFTLRSVSGIARELGRERSEVLHELKTLAESGLVTEVQARKGIRWALTPAGREKLPPDDPPPNA